MGWCDCICGAKAVAEPTRPTEASRSHDDVVTPSPARSATSIASSHRHVASHAQAPTGETLQNRVTPLPPFISRPLPADIYAIIRRDSA